MEQKDYKAERGAFKQPLRFRLAGWFRRSLAKLWALVFMLALVVPVSAHAEFHCGGWYWFQDSITTPLEADLCDTLRVVDEGQMELVAERDAAVAGDCHPEDLWQGDDDSLTEQRSLYRRLARQLKAELRRVRRSHR